MTLSRTFATIIGILNLALIGWIAMMLGYLNPRVWAEAQNGLEQTAGLRALSNTAFWLGWGGALFATVLWAFYLVYVQLSDSVPAKARTRWRFILLLGNIVAMPVFWYLYMWRPSRKR